MLNVETIIKKLQCNEDIVERYIADGTFGQGAEMTVGNDPAGVPSIVVNVGKTEVEEWLIKQLKRVLTEIFMDDFREPSLEFPSYSLEYAAGCPTKIYLNYSVCNGVEYDYSQAKDYLENTCPPDVISSYCADAHEHLWNIHKAMGVEGVTVFEDFNEVSSTIQMCKNLLDKITIKEK